MLDSVKELFRRQSLKKYSSTEPTGITPLSQLHSAVTFIDVEDTSFAACKNAIMAFYRDNNIKGEIFFYDFRKLGEGERLITSIMTTVLKKDLNWFGKPKQEKVDLMLQGEPDLFISLIAKDDYPIEFMAKCSKARFKVGRIQLPGNTFDLVVKDSKGKTYSEYEVFKEMVSFIKKIR